VAILVDMMYTQRREDICGWCAVGPVQLHQGRDEVALFTFDASIHERQDFTRDISTLHEALSDFEPFGTTSLYDATAATARRLAARSATHKAIIVLTDGMDTSSTLSARDVSGLASSIDVPVYVVATVPSLDQRLMMEASDRSVPSGAADLRDLAEWTGGQLVFASTFVETAVAASTLIDELRQQYVLAIEAASGREWRRIDVRVTAIRRCESAKRIRRRLAAGPRMSPASLHPVGDDAASLRNSSGTCPLRPGRLGGTRDDATLRGFDVPGGSCDD
jgi:VWFA-related protein